MPDTALFAAVFFLGTAYYPLCGLAPAGLAFQCLLLLALALLGLCLWPLRRGPRLGQPLAGQAALLALLQLPLAAAAYAFHARVQMGRIQQGIDWRGPGLALLAAGCLWTWSWRKRPAPATQALLAVLAGLALQAGSIATFQLGHFSDMLPLIQSSGRLFLAGQSPYSEVMLFPGEHIRCTYLPGLWLSYLPGVCLGLDLRWMNLAFLAAFGFFFYQGTAAERRPWAAALLVLFFANPWLAFRHEIYVPALLWVLALAFWAQSRQRPWLEAAALGFLAASSQLCWPLAFIWLLWRWRTDERPSIALAALVFAVVTLPFVLWDREGMAAGLFSHWKDGVEVTHFNLYHWLPSTKLMALLQAAVLLTSAAWAWRQPWRGLWPAALAATALFLLALFHVSHYFYFIPATLLLFSWIKNVDRF